MRTMQYLKEIYCVPAQPLVIRACADLVKARVAGDDLALSGKDRGAAEMMKGWLTTAKTEPEASTSTNRSPVSPANGKRKERLLILVGTYSIGKERLAKGKPAFTTSES
jgi:DNA cross-link repair 1A protein